VTITIRRFGRELLAFAVELDDEAESAQIVRSIGFAAAELAEDR
jgi:hypothetical protein